MKKNIPIVLSFLFLTLSTAAQQKETLNISWPEEYHWKVGSSQETKQVNLTELIPEKETLEQWTLMGNMMAIKGGQNIPVDVAMNMMYEQVRKNSDNAKLTIIEKDNTNKWILFTIEAASFYNDANPESQLYYIISGKTALYTNFIATKTASLKNSFITRWSKIFKSSEIVFQ